MLRPIQPYVEYVIDQDYIAAFLCINKNKPKMQCNGKCYLVKELEKQQDSDPLASLKVSLENYPIGFVDILKIPLCDLLMVTSKNQNTHYQNSYYFNYKYIAFQPPDLV